MIHQISVYPGFWKWTPRVTCTFFITIKGSSFFLLFLINLTFRGKEKNLPLCSLSSRRAQRSWETKGFQGNGLWIKLCGTCSSCSALKHRSLSGLNVYNNALMFFKWTFQPRYPSRPSTNRCISRETSNVFCFFFFFFSVPWCTKPRF